MSRRRVEFSPEALAHAEAAALWWDEHRPKAPGLFLDELDAAIARLATMPAAGQRYERAELPGMRRLLMPRTRYHVYYTADDSGVIRLHAIWHASRRHPEHL